ADDRAGAFGDRPLIDGGDPMGGGGRRLQEIAGPGARFEQGVDLGPQRRVPCAGPVQVLLPLAGGAQLQGLQEQLVRSWGPRRHGWCPVGSRLPSPCNARNRGGLRAKKAAAVHYFDSWRNSQARPSAQRRSAAPRLRPSASAASWCERPAK